jgi:phosphoribosylanthranilate isomerase
MTKIKICGIRDQVNLDTCIDHNVDWVGFNFSLLSKRKIELNDYTKLISRYSKFLLEGKKVFLFFKNTHEDIHEILKIQRPDFIQFIKGDVSSSVGLQISKFYHIPIIWQFGVSKSILDSDLEMGEYAFPILDKHSELGGGTGTSFQWEWAKQIQRKYLLAGGINSKNVKLAIETLNPWGVDVASGVEKIPGIKDPSMIREFVQNVRS